MVRVGDIEIQQELRFQRRMWVVQRVGWTVMLLLVLAGLLGLFGHGPLSGATAASADGAVRVEYERFGRFKSPMSLRIHARPEAMAENALRLAIDRKYLQGVQIQRIVPEPARAEAGDEGVVYVIPLAGSGQSATVTFYLKTETIGPLSGSIEAGDGRVVTISQFIYP